MTSGAGGRPATATVLFTDLVGNFAWSVHAKYEYARLLARRGDPNDQTRLCDLLADCLAGATGMGMTRVVDQTQSLADAAGVEL